MLSFTNIAILIILFLILFGAKRIPNIMKDIGKGLKNFKDALEGKDADEEVLDKRISSAKVSDKKVKKIKKTKK